MSTYQNPRRSGAPRSGRTPRRAPRPPRRTSTIVIAIVIGSILLMYLFGQRGDTAPSNSPSPQVSTNAASRQSAAEFVASPPPAVGVVEAARTLKVVDPRREQGYSRAKFGPGKGWPDLDGDRCSTRNEILRRDLTGVKYWNGGKNPRNCVVGTGNLRDPYTGANIAFDRERDAAAIQIDHVVALYDAWEKGAAAWPEANRLAFGNDPLNLLAVSGSANDSKGHDDASTWLPRNRGFVCEYAARQVAVKAKYGVGVSAREKSALLGALQKCDDPQLRALADRARVR